MIKNAKDCKYTNNNNTNDLTLEAFLRLEIKIETSQVTHSI